MSAGKNGDTNGSGLVRTSSRKPGSRSEAPTAAESEPKPNARAPARLSTAEVAGAGLRQIAQLIGKEVLGVTSIKALDDGWQVEVEAVEERRVPSSSDLLAVYEAELAEDGALLGYRRRRRYSRGWGDRGDSS